MKKLVLKARLVDLSAERVRALFDYDPADGRLHRKDLSRRDRRATAKGYFTITIDNRVYQEHRVVWLWHYGEWPSAYIDHVDKNPSNCKIENLRIALPYQNNGNSKISTRNKTGIKGVTTKKGSDRFRAQISINNKSKHIGIYDTKEEAAQAYARAAIQYFGEFASL
jgi:hypothetical protein